MSGSDEISRLRALLEHGGSTVFFGGAGVSTESGIPDFRSEQGLMNAQRAYGHSPEVLLSHSFFTAFPQIFFRYYKENLIHTKAHPNDAHRALAGLEQSGRLAAVITQNIDGLHQAAGSRTVHELHGSTLRNFCLECGARYDRGYIMDPRNCGQDGIVPRCARCGGMVRPDVVLYEEGLSPSVMASAMRAVESADTLIVGGSSLSVYPAAGLLERFRGRSLVIINLTPTFFDRKASLILRQPIGQALPAAARL